LNWGKFGAQLTLLDLLDDLVHDWKEVRLVAGGNPS